MSAAFFNQLADSELAHAISAGTQPAGHVHPVVVDVMREVGIDLSNAKPQKLTAELAENAEMLVTIGCGDECPYVSGLKRDDWPLPDPKDKGSNRYGKPETRSNGVFCSCWLKSS
jgi:protein-tyrosine-phosphatase